MPERRHIFQSRSFRRAVVAKILYAFIVALIAIMASIMFSGCFSHTQMRHPNGALYSDTAFGRDTEWRKMELRADGTMTLEVSEENMTTSIRFLGRTFNSALGIWGAYKTAIAEVSSVTERQAIDAELTKAIGDDENLRQSIQQFSVEDGIPFQPSLTP